MSHGFWSGNRVRVAVAAVLGAAVVIGLVVLGNGSGRPHRPAQAHASTPAPTSTPAPASAPARAATVRSQHFIIGHSVDNRRIDAFELGRPGAALRVLVVGCIHGNEPAGIAIARRLLGAKPAARTALWIVPVLNPDGVAAGTRQNAHGVDLNRNFPWRWRPLGIRGDMQYSGTRPLSEPEARAAKRLIVLVRPQITIWFHQPLGLVDLSGGQSRIERAFARLAELPVRMLTRYPGSAVSWGNALLPGTTAFVVELPPGRLTAASVARYAHAVLALSNPATSL